MATYAIAPECGWQFLLAGLSILLRGLQDPDKAETTVCSSFESVIQGLGARRAGLFLVRFNPDSTYLETFCSVGLSKQEIRAVECDKALRDTGLSYVWDSIRSQTKPDGPRSAGEQCLEPLHRLSSMDVLCLAVVDPILDAPSAVLYFEREAGADSEFLGLAKEWADAYRLALSQIIHVGFRQKYPAPPLAHTHAPAGPPENAPELIGDSISTQALRRELHDIHIPAASAPDPDPILILGEKGTGKDLVARYIYAYSARCSHPYVAVNCAEITDEMAAARFFGHKKGSFTGSIASEPGLFRAADRGVLFLDEIGDLSLRAQAALLRVLENRTVVPLGETREVRVDVQVILGTNCDPETAVAEGKMRHDFLDRFRTDHIRLLPLRERPWDIPALVNYFIACHEKRAQKKTLGLTPDVLKLMVGYSWSGNVRELARVCSLLITHAKPGMSIDSALFTRLFPHIAKEHKNPKAGALLDKDLPLRDALQTFGRELIIERLHQHNWNIKSARESLGLPKTTFHRYTRALGIAASIQGVLPLSNN